MNRLALAAALCSVTACSSAESPPVTEPALAPLFSFAVIADTHLVDDLEREARLEAAIAWIEAAPREPPIELVLVLGDIGWGGGLPRAKALLDTLSVPYVPLIGDNEIHGGDDQTFADVFAPTFAALEGTLGARRAATPVTYPSTNAPAWLENATFEHRGVRFYALDLCLRGVDGVMGEFGDLNDFDGGTLPWLRAELPAAAETLPGSVVLASHVPTFLGALDHPEMDALRALFAPLPGAVYANLAGHLHGDLTMEGPGFPALVTDAVWDDEVRVRRFDVLGNGQRFAYVDELVSVPYP